MNLEKDNGTITFYHGGSTPDFKKEDIDVFRASIKQGKLYAGFYMFGQEKRDKAFHYAKMAQNNLGVKNAGVSKIEIASDAKIANIGGEVGKIDRLTGEQLENFRKQGIDIITGKSFDGQQYVLLNPSVIKSMSFETIDLRYQNQTPSSQVTIIQEEPKKEVEVYVELEQLLPLLSESEYIYFGAGVPGSLTEEEIVNSIFKEGLETKENSLYSTATVLGTPTISNIESQLNNWPSQDAKKIIIIRVPSQYINYDGDNKDIDGEMYGAFMIEEVSFDGKVTNYLDAVFIIGYYDLEKKVVRINETFEKELSEQTLSKLKYGYQKALKRTQNRLHNMQTYQNMIKELQGTEQSSYEFETTIDGNLQAVEETSSIHK